MKLYPSPFSYADDVLRCPWRWTEISAAQAYLQYVFLPVVMVSDMGGFRRAEFLKPNGKQINACSLSFQPRFYMQIGTGKASTAKSPIAQKMDISTDGMQYIGKGWENPQEKGFQSKTRLYFSYDDGYGYPTIGYGHKIKPDEDFSKGLTPGQVQDLLRADLDHTVSGVNKQLTVGVTQSQFDALVALDFNVGLNQKAPGWTPKHKVTRPTKPIRVLNAGEAVKESDFTDYAKAHNKHHANKLEFVKSLQTRRKADWKIFNQGVYDARH